MNDVRALRILIADLIKQGWRVRHGGKHMVVYPVDKRFPPFTIAISPSDRYGHANALRDIRKAGGVVNH